MPYRKFHKKYSYYSRRKSTSDLINSGYEYTLISGPVLYVNDGVEVHILKNVKNTKELLNECKNDPKTKFALALRGEGDISFIRFKQGASMLTFYQNILPNFYSDKNGQIENVFPKEKGSLPIDPFPHAWTEEHWAIYNAFRFPRKKTFREAGEKIGLHWETTKKYYYDILKQCKVFTSFFPLGIRGYSYQIVLFKSKFEIGILRALKKLNRTSYMYKFNGTVLLGLFLGPDIKAYEKSADHFAYLEEIGLIHDLCISIPRNYTKHTI